MGKLLRDAADIFEYMTCVVEGEGRGPEPVLGLRLQGRVGCTGYRPGRRLQLQEDGARAVKLPPIDSRYVETPEPRLNPVFADTSQDDLRCGSQGGVRGPGWRRAHESQEF